MSDTVDAWCDRRMLAVGEAVDELTEAERWRLADALPSAASI